MKKGPKMIEVEALEAYKFSDERTTPLSILDENEKPLSDEKLKELGLI